MIIIALKFATPSEQYVDWGNDINFIFIRDQNSPPPMNNMLIGAIGFINTPSLPPSNVFSPIGLPVNLKHCAFVTHIFTWVSPPKSEFGCLKIGFHVNPQSLCS